MSQASSTGAGQSASQDETKKRKDYLDWDEYFMAIAFLSGMRSKDPCTQVGACIVTDDDAHIIVGTGYNGMARGCHDDLMPWGKNPEDKLKTKHTFVCHAEMNAVLNKNSSDVKGCCIYVSLFPCNECAKIIIQSGIKRVVYYCDKNADKPETEASKRMFEMAKVKLEKYPDSKRKMMTVDFDVILKEQDSTKQ